MQKEFSKFIGRKNKKRVFKKKSINHIQLMLIKYRLIKVFLSKEFILLNKKILASLICTEVGVFFSLIQWNFDFYSSNRIGIARK
uniref:Ribosomal protein L20 n=1 Tax=Hydropuntia rangiferina TaxID=338881 RepID=A0A345UBA5_9FLOR|nr:ribosomal protein L20 [Hydropuntia rangiferina]AXI97741.1 ribosomal protein L20 [Hydropuntia rangiferina]UAD89767.1 ribosomal protein L20 [Hydropuntia rangiferina]